MTFGAVFPRVMRPAFGPGLASATAASWWLAGGATGAVAVYQPKGAASLAASYVNLATPGTYDATPGVAPTFAAATGWAFNGSSQYLTTGVVPASGWSMIIRFSDSAEFTSRYIAGQHTANASFRIGWQGASLIDYYNGGVLSISATISAGTLAVAGQFAYRNGAAESGTIPAWSATNSNQIYIGCRLYLGGPGGFFAGKIQAVAIYNVALTAPQVAAISTAMAAL